MSIQPKRGGSGGEGRPVPPFPSPASIPHPSSTGGLKRSLQGSAGLLDAGAGLAQHLIGGGVADAEGRGEAEGRAMDGGDLGFVQEIADQRFVAVDDLPLGRRLADQAAGVGIDVEGALRRRARSEEHTSELQSLMRSSYAVFCLKKKTKRLNYRPYSAQRKH